jgi:hypothetical protein
MPLRRSPAEMQRPVKLGSKVFAVSNRPTMKAYASYISVLYGHICGTTYDQLYGLVILFAVPIL